MANSINTKSKGIIVRLKIENLKGETLGTFSPQAHEIKIPVLGKVVAFSDCNSYRVRWYNQGLNLYTWWQIDKLEIMWDEMLSIIVLI